MRVSFGGWPTGMESQLRPGLAFQEMQTRPPSTTFASVDRVNRPRESNSTPSPIETGPAVTAPSPLRWSSRGYDLVLVNRDALDSQKFASLIDSFEDAVPSRRNAGGRHPASLGRRCRSEERRVG